MTAKLTKGQRAEIQQLLDAVDNAIAALRDRADEITDEWEDEIRERSERWQESEACDEARERVEAMRTFGEPVRDAFDGISVEDVA